MSLILTIIMIMPLVACGGNTARNGAPATDNKTETPAPVYDFIHAVLRVE